MPDKLLLNTNGVTKISSRNGYPETSITETIINGFFTVDRKWTVKYWNKAAEKLLGVHAKDIVGKNLWEKFAGILPLNFYTIYHKAFLQNMPIHFEEYWGEMGSWFDVIAYHCDDTLSVSFKSSNQSVDPEHPKHPEQRLKIVNELYRFVTEVTNDCLWEWDLQTNELFWIDGGHKRVFGYPIENALIPQSFWESLLHPDDKVRVLTKLNRMIAEESVNIWEDEYRFQKADGDYISVHDRGHIIYDKDRKALRMIGATQDISEKVALENKLTEERLTRNRELTAAVFTAQENERADIGKELHDNLGQVLAVAKMYLQMAKKSEKKRELFIEKSCDFIETVINEVRKISKVLVIPAIHIIGLFDNIQNLVNDLVTISPIKIKFQHEGIKEIELDEKMQVTIFRIVQEQMNNILKHANAVYATIHLSRQKNQIILIISDNGKGCDILKDKTGVGIINIKSRAELYGGKVMIVSKPAEGYELKVVLPLNDHNNTPELLKVRTGL